MVEHKDPKVRKNEILDAAQQLFLEKGYAKTTVIDILNVHGLSKGVFYYYFKSKEQVMDAIIDRIVDAEVQHAKTIAATPNMTIAEKLLAVLSGAGRTDKAATDKQDIINHIHNVENAEMHQKSLVQTVKHLSPVIADIVCKDSDITYPTETAALLLAGGQFIFDEGLFNWTAEERNRHAVAFIEMMERTLKAKPEQFNDIKKHLLK